jgi:hypothetical protein
VVVARVVAAVVAVALVTVGYLASRRGPVQPSPNDARLDVALRAPSVDGETLAPADDAPPAEAAASGVRAALATFRNSSFLIAIRRAGFYCDDVVMAYESVDGVWVASCLDKGGYLVTVLGVERFDVEPVPHYFDGVGPVLLRDDRLPSERLRRLEPLDRPPFQR